uniref:EOG090X0N2I n=1 Tax=Megafenestra aurita TaxID=2291010 RepID=A0A4Y7NJR4_9CRUS|nr:EOG090X0N2I [Megafenestra aurita]SVE92816.1 EOG090X0N2I [Megafenestra aurita]
MENTNLYKELNNIPLADDDPQAVIPDDGDDAGVERDPSLDSMSSRFTNDSSEHPLCDGDINLDEQEEKARLIAQVMELQNTLDDLSQRVDSVKEENLKLRSENQVLGQYIENLMAASSVFQSTSPKTKKK